MYLNHRVLARINQVFSRLTMSAMLLDKTGHVILPENNNRVFNLPEDLLKEPTKVYVNGAFTLVGTEETSPLFLCIEGYNEEVQSCARICVELINIYLQDDQNTVSKDSSIRLILDGEIEPTEIEALSKENQIKLEDDRAVLFMHFTVIDSEAAVQIVKKLIEESEGDYVCEISRHALALVKSINETMTEGDLEQYAQALQNTFVLETGAEALIGIGETKHELAQLRDSLEEAKTAITIGRNYHPKQQIFVYSKMVLERFLVNIPEDMALSYHKTLFNSKNGRLFNDEMLSTIEKFFENSLNLSETARQLYIHRNTLVYRLDKIQKTVGLDLRSFDDAMTFKLLMLMGKQSNDRKNRYNGNEARK